MATLPSYEEFIQTLADAHADVQHPHEVDFFLLFPSEAAAREAARRLADRGFAANLEASTMPWWQRLMRGSMWWCHAHAALTPATDEGQQAVALMVEVAGEMGGHYDGWAASPA